MLTGPAFFASVGYLKVPGVIDTGLVARLQEATRRIAADDYHPTITQTPDRTRIDHVVSADPAFTEVATSGCLLDALTPVLGPNIELVENRHNHLTVYHAPTKDRLHRDILQWSRSLLTALVYLSDCTDLDSATSVVPGSHLWPCVGAPNNGGTWMDEAEQYAGLCDQAVAIPAHAGDLLLLHGQLYHAGAGASDNGRRTVLTLAFRSVDELASEPPGRCRLVRGQRIYRGRGGTRV